MGAKLVILMLAIAAIGLSPIAVEDASACQPYSWYCPVTGNYYHGCGTTGSNSPAMQCLRDTRLPP